MRVLPTCWKRSPEGTAHTRGEQTLTVQGPRTIQEGTAVRNSQTVLATHSELARA